MNAEHETEFTTERPAAVLLNKRESPVSVYPKPVYFRQALVHQTVGELDAEFTTKRLTAESE